MKAARPERNVSVEQGDAWLVGRFTAMASPCEVLCELDDTQDVLELTSLVATEAWRIEDKLSRYVPGNIIDQINNAAGAAIEVDAETAQLIDFAATLYQISERKFDITSGVLRKVWRFDGSSNIPSQAAIHKVMRKVGWHRVQWDSPQLRMNSGMEIDLGGIGKEYAVDRAAQMLREQTSVSCLVNFGGDLVATKKPTRHKTWRVGIESLGSRDERNGRILNLDVGALATSGDARRFLIREGVRYSHILNPQTGWPVPDAPRSVTVAADTCTQAGMLSTMAMLNGAQAEAFLDGQDVRHWCDRG